MTSISLREEWADDVAHWLGISGSALLAEPDWKVELLPDGKPHVIFGADFPDEVLAARGRGKTYQPSRANG